MKRVDIEAIQLAHLVISGFNQTDLADVEFFHYGQKVEVPPGLVERYRLTGLSNRDFVLEFLLDKDAQADLMAEPHGANLPAQAGT